MELTEVIALVTCLVTIICGYITKKHPKISNKIIPIQNLLIGLVVAIIEWVITKDFKTAIALSGLLAGGTYDVAHNINKMRGE
jgi:di/tricarboxylate transporter